MQTGFHKPMIIPTQPTLFRFAPAFSTMHQTGQHIDKAGLTIPVKIKIRQALSWSGPSQDTPPRSDLHTAEKGIHLWIWILGKPAVWSKSVLPSVRGHYVGQAYLVSNQGRFSDWTQQDKHIETTSGLMASLLLVAIIFNGFVDNISNRNIRLFQSFYFKHNRFDPISTTSNEIIFVFHPGTEIALGH